MRRFHWTFAFLLIVVLALGCNQQSPTPAPRPSATPPPGDTPPVTEPGPSSEPSEPRAEDIEQPQEEPTAMELKSWDFSELEPDQWNWSFPSAKKNQTDRGALFGLANGNTISLKEVSFPAEDFSALRLELQVMQSQIVDGRSLSSPVTPESIEIQWTQAVDNGENLVPSVQFTHSDTNSNQWTAPVGDDKSWEGMITSLAIAVNVPEGELEEGQYYDVYVQQIELVARSGPTS